MKNVLKKIKIIYSCDQIIIVLVYKLDILNVFLSIDVVYIKEELYEKIIVKCLSFSFLKLIFVKLLFFRVDCIDNSWQSGGKKIYVGDVFQWLKYLLSIFKI